MSTALRFVSELSLVGTRNYVLGADLFREFERGAHEQLASAPPTLVRSFKLHREIAHSGLWVAGLAHSASAELEWLDASGRAQRASFVEGAQRIEARSPDRPLRLEALEHDGNFGGRALAPAPHSTSELLYALVEGNKAHHLATLRARGLPHDRIRFIYIEALPWLATPSDEPWELAYKLMGARPAADRTYTLVAVRSPQCAGTIKICYSHGH